MNILPRPISAVEKGPELWVDEAIWGHRLHDEQTPWLAFLEFMGVLRAEAVQGRTLKEEAPNTLSYRPQHQLKLRNILFNNPHVVTVRAEFTNDEERWSAWLERMADTAGGLDNKDFKYLRNHFDNFEDLAAVIALFQSSAIEGNSNKRWSSKFVFPFGANALYEDVNAGTKSVSNDRRFFGRTGEVLYMMLCRTSLAEELGKLLTHRLMAGEGPYDSLLKILQGEPQLSQGPRGGAYLPLSGHPRFDRLAEDWISLLRSNVPIYDVVPHLVTMGGLNLILYQLERAREVIGSGPSVNLVWEILGPKRTKVRDLSAKSFDANQSLPWQAVEGHIRAVTATAEWQTALLSDHARLAVAEVLEKHFEWPDSEELGDAKGEPAQLLEELVKKAQVRHRQHVGRFHMAWSRQIGLSSRRSSRSTRYAPTDRLLKSLVVCRVQKRMELNEFMASLYERYRVVIGPMHAGELTGRGAADHEDFADNRRRLEERLASLGLLERFSDSCAYVVNPFERITT